jgi:ribosomal protein S16
VVAKAQCAPSGKFVETLGHFNPRNKKDTLSLKKERISYWLSQGAKASPIVHNLLVDQDITTGPKKKATRARSEKKNEEAK